MQKKSKKNIVIIAMIIIITFLATAGLASRKKAPAKKPLISVIQQIATIGTENQPIQISLPVFGRISSVKKVDIYAEVSGILENSQKEFLEGNTYSEGDLLLNINSDEATASLKSLKSNFLTQLTSFLVELKYEYPESYNNWANYMGSFDLEKPLQALPKPASDKEKIFLSSQGIYDSYYSIESQEIRLKKYTIAAPFDGIITESNIKPGMLVMSGQKLGSYVNEDYYDLEVAVKLDDLELIQTGNKAEMISNLTGKSYTGTVQRINGSINQSTQTVNVYVRISGESLKENMFLEGNILSTKAFYGQEIPRKCLLNNQSVYVVNKNSIVSKKDVTIYQIRDDIAIIGGLADGTLISERTSGIYEGLKVKTDQDDVVEEKQIPKDNQNPEHSSKPQADKKR